MEDRVLAPAFVLLAAVLAISNPSQASAADPSGIWAKDDGSAKVAIKKCGRGICGEVVWLRSPKDSRGKPLHDVRNENPSLRDRPIIGLPLFINMRPTGPNAWAGNVYNPVEGRIYTDVKVTLVSRQQILLRGCKTWLLCGEKTWTRSSLPADTVAPERPIEVKAPAEPGSTDKVEPSSTPQLETLTVEAIGERELLSAPGFAFVTASARQRSVPMSGDDVLSMVAMTIPPMPTTVAPSLTETATAEEQWPWMQRRSVRLASNRNEAKAVPVVLSFAKPGPKPVVMAAQEQWPWQQRRSRTVAQAPAPTPATPIFVKPKPKPAAREAREQWPWMQRRSVVVVATRTGGY